MFQLIQSRTQQRPISVTGKQRAIADPEGSHIIWMLQFVMVFTYEMRIVNPQYGGKGSKILRSGIDPAIF